jgi:DNA-binding NarL/FixJ family response regulator
MDIGMPGLNGLDAVAQIKKDFPQVQVLILSMHSSDQYVVRALQAGASGYLHKDSAKAELDLAVRAVAGGKTYLSPIISKYVISHYLQRPDDNDEEVHEDEIGQHLTGRQREVLQLIAESYTTKKMADTMHLSVKTIETYRAQLMTRIDIHDIAGLVRYAIRIGLVTSEK